MRECRVLNVSIVVLADGNNSCLPIHPDLDTIIIQIIRRVIIADLIPETSVCLFGIPDISCRDFPCVEVEPKLVCKLERVTEPIIMVFDWMREGVYTALGGEKTVAFVVPDASPYTPDATTAAVAPIDKLLPRLRAEYPEAEQFEIHYPHSDSASIYVEITYERGVYYSSDYRFYDQRTLAEVETPSIYGLRHILHSYSFLCPTCCVLL